MPPQQPSLHHLLNGWRFNALIGVIVLSALGYLLIMLWGGWDDVVSALIRVGAGGTLAALGLSLVNYYFRFLRWEHYLKILNCQVPFWPSLKIYIAGFSLTATPAKAGEMLRSIFLRDYGLSYHASLGAFLSERVSDLIAILLLSLLGLWEYPGGWLLCALTGLVIVLVLIGIQQKSWLMSIERWALKNESSRIGAAVHFFTKILIAFRSCFALTTLSYGAFLGVIAWGAEALAFYYILHLLGVDVSLYSAIFIYAFSVLVGAITFLPGGLGGVEVTMVQLLVLNHATRADAVVATIIIRLATLWFSVLLGLLALPLIKKPPTAEESL